MKISQARMTFAAEHQSEQLDAQISQESQEEVSLTRHSRRPWAQGGLAQIFVDRVSISQHQKMETQYNYSADVQSKSSVRSADSQSSTEFEQHETLGKIVGGIIDKQVTIRKLNRNEDIQIGNGPSTITSGVTGEMSEVVAGERLDESPGEGPNGRPDGRPDDKFGELTIQDAQRSPRLMRSQSIQTSKLSLSHTQIHFEQESAQFSSQGQVTTEDGRVIDFSLDMSLERSFLSRTEEETLVARWQEQINLTDPLVISLDGKAPALSDTVFEFDLNNDGETENVNFTGAGTGFLSFDKNADGVINNGSELFGPGTGNGFTELAAFDEDKNHWIDENDAVFSQLSVWTKDEDGQDKLVSLKDAGIGAIALDYADTLFNMTGSDNQLSGQLKQSGVFLFENGNVGSVHQVDLVSHEIVEEKSFAKEQLTIERVQPDAVPFQGPIPQLSPQPEVAPNPLQDLLDRIDELKEKLASLVEEMTPISKKKSSRRHQRRSLYTFGDNLMMDPSMLLSRAREQIGGAGRVRRWYG